MMGLPNCSEVARQLSLECDLHYGARHRSTGMRLHLLMCAACRRYERYLAWLQTNLPRAMASTSGARLSTAQRASIREALHRSDN